MKTAEEILNEIYEETYKNTKPGEIYPILPSNYVLKAMEEYGKLMYNQAIEDSGNKCYSYYLEMSGEVTGFDYKDELLKLKKNDK